MISVLVPRPLHFVPAPACCEISDGISLSIFAIHIGSVNGVKSSRLGSRCNIACISEDARARAAKFTFLTQSYGASQPLVSRTTRGGEDEKEWYIRVSYARKRTLSTRRVNRERMKTHVGITRCYTCLLRSLSRWPCNRSWPCKLHYQDMLELVLTLQRIAHSCQYLVGVLFGAARSGARSGTGA